MIGEDRPLGTGIFHFTFLSGPISTGGFWPSATPDPFGPRNLGHGDSSAPKLIALNNRLAAITTDAFMSNVLRWGGESRPARAVRLRRFVRPQPNYPSATSRWRGLETDLAPACRRPAD